MANTTAINAQKKYGPILLTLLVCTFFMAFPLKSAAAQISFPQEWGVNILSKANNALPISSSQLEDADHGIDNLIDGDATKGAPYCSWNFSSKPAFVIIKLPNPFRIDRLAFLNDQRDGVNFHVKDVQVYVSNDGELWKSLKRIVLPQSSKLQTVVIKNPVTAAFLKFEIKSNYGADYAVLEEIAAFGAQVRSAPVFRGTAKYDVMELKNGDLLTGTMLNDQIGIQTAYARLAFRKDQIASLLLEGDIANIEQIIVINGDVFSGFVLEKTIRFRLSTGSEIEVRREKIKRMGIRMLPYEKKEYPQKDVTVLKNGDVFSGVVKTTRITVQTSYASVPAKISDIALIEFIGKDRVVTKIRLKNGNTMQGLLQEEDLAIDLDYGPEILIYKDKIDRIEFRK